MKKTTIISISGRPYYVEEDGFEKLDNYLRSIKDYFPKEDEEIINDIESRIGEQFSSFLNDHKKVITLNEVEEVIKTMGMPEDFADTESTLITKNEGSTNSRTSNRRLMRDPDRAIIGGVCAGLGAYFGIDPIIFRVLFLAMLFGSGIGFIAYIILLIAMPEAKTVTEKMQMQGSPLTLENIKAAHEKNLTNNGYKNVLRRALQLPVKILQNVSPFFAKFLGGLMIVLSSIALVSITIAFGAFSTLKNSENVESIFTTFPSTFTDFSTLGSIYLTILLPLIFIIILGLSLIKRKFILKTFSVLTLLGLWIVAASLAGTLAVKTYPKIQKEVRAGMIDQTMDTQGFSNIDLSGNFPMYVKKGNEFKVRLEGHKNAAEKVDVLVENNTLFIKNKPDQSNKICFICDSHVSIHVTMPDIDRIAANNSTFIEVEEFSDLDNLTVDLNGNAKAGIYGSVDNLNVAMYGYSFFNGFELKANNAQLNLNNGAVAQVNVTNILSGELYNNSRVSYRGEPRMEVKTYNSSDIQKTTGYHSIRERGPISVPTAPFEE